VSGPGHAADSNDDGNGSDQSLTSDQRQRIALARSAPTWDMSGLKTNGRDQYRERSDCSQAAGQRLSCADNAGMSTQHTDATDSPGRCTHSYGSAVGLPTRRGLRVGHSWDACRPLLGQAPQISNHPPSPGLIRLPACGTDRRRMRPPAGVARDGFASLDGPAGLSVLTSARIFANSHRSRYTLLTSCS